MRKISDNDIDKLFKSAFDDLEIKPSEKVWENIKEDLHKKNKIGFYFWLSAASVIIMFGFGLYFFNTTAVEQEEKDKINNQIVAIQPKVDKATNDVVNNSSTIINTEKHIEKNTTTFNLIDKIGEKDTKVEIINNRAEVLTTVVSNLKAKNKISKIETEKTKIEQQIFLENNLVLAKTDDFLEKESKIKSINDLINFVVSKVDKREEKLLTMNKTDECDMEVTSLNFGLIKYRKEY